MKKLLPAILFFLAISQLSAQESFNRAYHDVNEHPNPFLVSIYGDLYFTTQRFDAGSFGLCYLYKHSASGVLKYKSMVIGGNTPTHAYKSLDNKLIVVGQISMCDAVMSNMPNFITKLDTSGNVVFTSTYSAVFQDVPKAAFQHSDSSYYSFTDSLMIKHNKTGQFVSRTNLGLTNISSAKLLANNTILISAKQSNATSLVVISPSGTILSSVSFPILLSKLTYYGGQKVMGLGVDGNLYKLSTSLSLIGFSTFPNGSGAADFVCDKDTVYAILSSSSALSNYAVSDSSFNIISSTSTTTNKINQYAIAINNDKTVILSEAKSKNSYSFPEHYFVSLSVINRFTSNNFSSDIKIVSLNIDSISLFCIKHSFPPYDYSCSAVMRAKVRIKNKGTTTITSFKLNCFLGTSIACGGEFYQQKFTDFSLSPGDSITVTSASFFKSVGTSPGPFVAVESCFYTTLPNDETDKTLEDNESCTLGYYSVTSLREHSKLEQKISVAPNPFEDSINIQADSEIKQVDVFNTLGMLVKSAEGNDQTITLHNSELQNGIYFLKIKTEKGMITKKVLKN
jgi:hypothetical protein